MARATTSLFTKKTALAALAVASVLLLSTGCAAELNAGGAGGSGGSSSNDRNKDGSDKDGTKDSIEAALTGKTCFPGTWLANNKDIQSYMESLSTGASIVTSGKVILTFNTDDTSVTNYDHWTHSMTLSDMTSVVERHGVDHGTYTASEDGAFTASDTSINSVTTMTASGGGQNVSMAVAPEPTVFDEGTYTCSGDLLTMNIDEYTVTLTREK